MIKINDLIKKPKVKIIFGAVVIALVSVVFLKFAYDFWKENSELKDKIKRDHDEITRSTKISATQELLNSEIKKMTLEMATIEKIYFTNTEEIFARLNRFTQETRISLRSISPGERTSIEIPNQAEMYLELLPLNIKLNCDFKQLIEFLKKIEKFEKMILVDNIKIQNDQQDIWNHNIEIELKAPLLIYAKTTK